MSERLEVVLGGSRHIWDGGQVVEIGSVGKGGIGGSFETKNADLPWRAMATRPLPPWFNTH
ncbi:MAG: hypothetical protein JXB14_05085 [Candidatus Altiarchaeota archaeon]|nr:hypothetical protein [Candidatus Altiarchaeota archaeon]